MTLLSYFYHIRLDERSANLCTFITPFGRYKFLKMPYGLAFAPEVFKQRLKNIYDLEGVEVYIDDIIAWVQNSGGT